MPNLNPAMLGLKLASLVAVAVTLVWLWGEHTRADRLAVEVKGWERCEQAVLGKPAAVRAAWRGRAGKVADQPADVCPPGIASAAAIAASTLACSEALAAPAPPATLGFTVSTRCPAGVQRLYAESESQGRRIANLNSQLDGAEASAGRAIARAQAQARTEAERTARAATERNAAVRDPAGLRACDAQCLRNRSQGWVAPPG